MYGDFKMPRHLGELASAAWFEFSSKRKKREAFPIDPQVETFIALIKKHRLEGYIDEEDFKEVYSSNMGSLINAAHDEGFVSFWKDRSDAPLIRLVRLKTDLRHRP